MATARWGRSEEEDVLRRPPPPGGCGPPPPSAPAAERAWGSSCAREAAGAWGRRRRSTGRGSGRVRCDRLGKIERGLGILVGEGLAMAHPRAVRHK